MTISTLIAIGALASIAFFVATLVFHFIKPTYPLPTTVGRYAPVLGFIVSLAAILVSLYYSEILNYPPCDLCVLQRIFIYPQVLVFGYMAYTKNRDLLFVPIVLSLIGGAISIYHNYLDWGGEEFVACGTTVSCTQRFVFEFGFVTIPLLSLIGFVSVIIIAGLGMYYDRAKNTGR